MSNKEADGRISFDRQKGSFFDYVKLDSRKGERIPTGVSRPMKGSSDRLSWVLQ
jgi:hypothetical protein